jgi:hypothetical protein
MKRYLWWIVRLNWLAIESVGRMLSVPLWGAIRGAAVTAEKEWERYDARVRQCHAERDETWKAWNAQRE